jgi:hypothetical protein
MEFIMNMLQNLLEAIESLNANKLFSMAVGLFFGIYPASQPAARGSVTL